MSEDSIRVCRNPQCRWVGRPDPRIYKQANEVCPRCGYRFDQPPPWKGKQNV